MRCCSVLPRRKAKMQYATREMGHLRCENFVCPSSSRYCSNSSVHYSPFKSGDVHYNSAATPAAPATSAMASRPILRDWTATLPVTNAGWPSDAAVPVFAAWFCGGLLTTVGTLDKVSVSVYVGAFESRGTYTTATEVSVLRSPLLSVDTNVAIERTGAPPG